MSTLPHHLEFAPPPTPGLVRGLALAIVAHAVLLAILAAGVQWKRDAVQAPFEAELWSAVPVQAAPPAPLLVPEETKPNPPAPKPEPQPEPKPVPAPDTSKADADIALQKKLAKQKLEKKLALEKAEQEKKKLAELEKQKQAKLEQDKKDKLAKQKKELADKLVREQQNLQRQQDAKERQQLDEQRQKAIKRMEALAGAGGNGSTSSIGAAAQAGAPSASYAGRIVARIKPNITYADRDSIIGNPRTEVEIRTSPSGIILSARITQSSGIKSWDEAVLRAIDKTEILPKDADGTVQPSMLIGFKPKD